MFQEKRDRDIQEIKKLLRQYHNEVKTIASSIKDTDNEQMDTEKKENDNQESTVEMQRSKRSLSETLEKHRQGREKLRNKIKSRRTMYENKIKERNALSKYGQRFRRIKRETEGEKETNINELGESTVDNSIVVQPTTDSSTTECPTATISSTESVSTTKTDTTKAPIVGQPPQPKPNASKIRALTRKLVQQKRLEERISAYLEKIKESTNHITQEIQRSSRSIREDNSEMANDNRENMIDGVQNYFTGIHIGADPELVNPLQNTIRKDDTNNLYFDILKRNHDLIDIRKREISNDLSTEIRNRVNQNSKMFDDNRTTKWNNMDEDKTKEEEIYFNEIPKDDNMMIKSLVNNEEYSIKPKILPNYNPIQKNNYKLREHIEMEENDNMKPTNSDANILFNEISKEDKFLPAKLRKEEFIYVTGPKILNTENHVLQEDNKFKEEINKSEDEYGTKSELAESTEMFNIKIPVKQDFDKNVYEIVPPYPIFDTESISTFQETSTNSHDFKAKVTTFNRIQNNNINLPISEENGDRRENVVVLDNKVWKTTNKVHQDGLVDNVFETVFNFLNNFHRKIADYLKYLAR